jgi:Ca2+-binding RTX toxin-like protein
MFRYLRSAPKAFRSYLAPPQRRPSRKEKFLRPLQLEPLEDRALLAGLNSVIDNLLQAHFPTTDPNPAGEFTFDSTTDPTLVPTDISVGTTVGGGTADLELTGVSLTFSHMEFVSGNWTGEVAVEADSGVLFPGLFDIPIDDGDDAGSKGVAGTIDLSVGNSTSRLALDDLDAEELGWPKFLDINFSQLALTFDDFRQDDNLNSLFLKGALTGFDTGNDNLNQLLSASNPLFGLKVTGSAETTLDIKAIEDSAAASILDIKTAMQLESARAVAEGLSGVSGDISGKLFKVGDFDAGFDFHTVKVDPDGSGSLPEQTVSYLAVKGAFSIGDEALGGRSSQWEIGFAVSELGPLHFFVNGGQIRRFEPTTGLTIEKVRLGVRFNTTIEELQAEKDFETSGATSAPAASGTGFIVTMTIPGHDLVVGDRIRVRKATSNPKYNSTEPLEVLTVVGDKITYKVASDPGQLSGPAEIIRLTIRDPFDLRDAGLAAGIGVPDDIQMWEGQLDDQVTNQIKLGDNVWEQLFQKAVFGGGATISIDPIPDTMLVLSADLLIDTDLRILMNGTISLADGLIEGPASMYADLSKLTKGEGKFLYIADIPTIDAVLAEPLIVMRGEISFATVKDPSDATKIIGFKIIDEGAIDLNIPQVTTLTLQGTETLTLTVPSQKVALLEFDVNASLSEPNIGTIGTIDGQFFVKVDGDKLISQQPLDGVELWGAALLTSNFKFLEKYGLFANASGVLRINSSRFDKDPIALDVAGETEPRIVALPAKTAALRLDGNVEFFIDFDKNNKFDAGESMALFSGIFVFELTATQGFNVAIFDEDAAGAITTAKLELGPTVGGRRLFTAQTLGNLAIRASGIAAHIYVGVSAKLPLDLAELNGQAVLIFNTTGQEVEFAVPGGASDPNRPAPGSTLKIPAAGPSKPGEILAAASSAADPAFNALKTGSPTWKDPSTAGPYGVLFVKGNVKLLGVLENEVAGYALLSKDLVSIDATFSAERNFLNLVKGSVKGKLFYSSEGEFQLTADGSAQLGPDWLNIHGGAHLVISYLDSNDGIPGDGKRGLNVTGSLNVGLTVDIDPLPKFDVTLAALTVGFKSDEITVTVTYPEPFWDESCVDTVIFGVVCIPYPNVRDAKYTFSIGTLTATPAAPPPPVLGQVDSNGVLTLNVGASAAARKLLVDEVNELVTIDSPAAGSILVSMFDHSKRFDNVQSILIADMGAGTDVVEIKQSVSTPLEVHFGAGNDRLKNDGTGVVKAYGDAGSDRLVGGGASDSLYGGTGEDFIDGRGGQDLIEGDDDGDKLIGGTGADTIKGGKGGDLIVGDLVQVTSAFADPAKTILVSSEFATKPSAISDGDTIEGGDGADVVFGGSGSDNITGNAGADRLFGGDGKATFFSATVTVVGSDLGFDGDDRMTWTVGDASDVIDGQAGSDTLDIFGSNAADTGTLTATKITGLGTGTDGISYASLETLNFSLGLGGDNLTVQETASGTANSIKTGSGNDTITVIATGLGSSITLDGQGDGDTYNIQLGSLISPVKVSDGGAGGSDALNVKGIAGVNEIVLELARLTRGTDVVNYSGIETLQIDTSDGADTFKILDNGAITTINSGKGDDQFVIGPAVNEDGEVIDADGDGTNTDELGIKGTSFDMTINGGDDNDDFEVNRNTAKLFLNGENGNDVFVINTLISSGNSTVDGGGDVDTITYLASAPVHINGGNGHDTIIVNGTRLDDFFIITGTTIEVVGSRQIDYSDIESFQANGRKGNDTFELRGMLAAVDAALSGGAGNDTFNLGSLDPVTVDAIDGPVTVSGGDDEDTLNVIDTGDTTANTGALTSTMLTGLGMQNGVTYGTLEALNISLGSGGNTFTIEDTYTGPTVLNSGLGGDTVNVRQIHGKTTVNTQAGYDTINVGSLAPAVGGAVNQIVAALIVNGGDANPDTLNVDDTGDAAPNSGVLTATQLTGLGMGVGITYAAVESLNISLGAGGNTFHVKATAAGTATTLSSGDGNDTLAVDSNCALANGTVDGVVSGLTINGQGGFNILTLEDYSDTTGDTVHVTPTQIGAAAGDTFFGPGGSLTYSELDQVTLNMSQAYLPDTIYLTPSDMGTEFFIRGRNPQTPMQRAQLPGDALYLDIAGLTPAERLGVRLNATGVNDPADPVFNVWNIPGHAEVNYKQIEKMNHVQTLAVAADSGGSEPRVKVIDAETGLEKLSFLAYDPGFKGGVRAAVGDVNGDAIPDIITSSGSGGGPHVRVFNGATGERFIEPIGDFFAFPAGSRTTVQVAVADFNQDGLADIVTGADSGGQPIVKVFDAYKLLTGQANPIISQFFAYDRRFAGGVRLAVGDLNKDGVPDIATGPGSGLNSQVRIFKTNLSADQATVTHSLLTSFLAFPTYNGGVNLAVGDVTGDGRADIVVGSSTGGTAMTRVYNGAGICSGKPPALLADLRPYGSQSGGVRMALVDLDGDGVNELITASALTGSKVKPKAFDLLPNGSGGLTPAAIDAYFANHASDPFFEGALFLGGGN